MITSFDIAVASLLVCVVLVGCRQNDKTMRKDIKTTLATAVEKKLDPDSVIELVGKSPNLDSRIQEHLVYLKSEEFEMKEGQEKLKENEILGSGFDEADYVLIWFADDNELDSGVLWKNGQSKYFNGTWIVGK